MYDKLFVGGDLSGIQKFLYNITSKKAAVSLKGRSFYLRQYMDGVCKRLTELPEVSAASPDVIYCSGGKLYVIIQNSPQTQEALASFTKREKSEIWKEHRGQLSINISWVPFSENADGSINANGCERQPLGFLWQCMTEDFARQKNQKFLEEIRDNYEDFFEVIPVGGKPKVCAVTGIESSDCVSVPYKDENLLILRSVKQQIELGEELRKKDNFLTFEEYASDSYLGILRMDVDGLGKLFANGFPTIDEYKAFSNHLDAYFTSKGEHISNLQRIQQKDDYRTHLNIIFAGGDDIFVVGRWDKVIDFAAEVRDDFVKYVNGDERFTKYINDDHKISLSGGVAIVHPKFPIAKAAEMAGDAEDAAKKHSDKNGTLLKNAFCMFGQVVSWKDEFAYVEQYKNEFVDLIIHMEMPRGILHKIMSYAAIAARNNELKKTGKPENYSYIWHSAYYLTRVIERQNKNTAVVEFCKRLRDRELYGKTANFRLMAIAARWAELTIRMNQK